MNQTKLLSIINREVFVGDKYPLKHLMGEIGELLIACLQLRPDDILSELEQVVFDIQHIVHCYTGWDWRPVLCGNYVRYLYARLDVWRGIFQEVGLVFSPKYLRGGANYERLAKVERALEQARLDQLQPN